jgi:hypothetical protein
MSFDETIESSVSKPRRFRIRFSLLALLLFVTFVCILLAWLMLPNRVVATAMFHVRREQPTLLGDQSRNDQDIDTEFEITKKSQIAAMKSYFVLQAALRKPGVSSLAILAPHEDPAEWLTDNLTAEFPENGEYLSISLEGVEEHSADLQRIVDAVANAYSDEVLFKEKQRRLGERDLLAMTLDKLKSQLQDKWEVYIAIVQESGQGGGKVEITKEVLMKRLDRIESELLRLEDEQLRLETSGGSGNAKFYEQRLAQLRERQSGLDEAINNWGTPYLELKMREEELEVLDRTVNDLARKLKRLEIEANAPSRIEQVQQAVVSPAD